MQWGKKKKKNVKKKKSYQRTWIAIKSERKGTPVEGGVGGGGGGGGGETSQFVCSLDGRRTELTKQ